MDEVTGTGLPASLLAAWGKRDRAPRGPKPGLTLTRIVDAAVNVAAAEGLGAVSMSRVAAELGTAPMSLYRYVGAKDELLELMIDVAVGPPPEIDDSAGWRAGLSRWALAVRAALRRHPWVVHIQLHGPPITPNQIGWLEAALRCLRASNLEEGEKLAAVLLISGLTWRESTLAVDIENAQASDSKWVQVAINYGATLAGLLDADRHPHVSAMVASGIFEEPGDPDYEFVFGLERILDGIDALISSRAAAKPARPTAAKPARRRAGRGGGASS
jgi:AcrR family transcriptional regulator